MVALIEIYREARNKQSGAPGESPRPETVRGRRTVWEVPQHIFEQQAADLEREWADRARNPFGQTVAVYG